MDNIISATNTFNKSGFTIIFICVFLLLLFLAIVIGYTLAQITNKCVKEEIVYRYIPRKILDQQYDNAVATDFYKSMFTSADTWAYWLDYDDRKKEATNKYFISQL